jgi:hypothetical protein
LRSPASSATGRRCWRTGTAGTPRRPRCYRPKLTSTARSRCSTRPSRFPARLLPGRAPDRRDEGARPDPPGPPR